MSSWKHIFLNWNIFKLSDDLITDEEKQHERQSNVIATRMFFIVFIIVLLGLSITIKSRSKSTLITIDNPTTDQFKNLPFDAHCPCSHVSLSYGEFLSIQTRFHQICSSDFISDRWIKATNFGLNTTYFPSSDFRTQTSAVFQSLKSFCRLSKDYTIQSVEALYKDLFISQQVLEESVFQSQINKIIQQFEISSPIGFSTQVSLIQKMIPANRFLSALLTDYSQYYWYFETNQILIAVHNRALSSSDNKHCSCRVHVNCSKESMIFNEFGQVYFEQYPDMDRVWTTIPGILHSCVPVNTMIFSTLECFYNQTCLNILISFLSTTENFTAMSKTEQSQYDLNSPLLAIVENLMIEEWMANISYEKYYKQCAPISCTYFENEKYDWKFVLIQLIGLLGCIIMACGFITQNIVSFIRRRPSQNIESIPCKFSGLIH